MHEKGVDERKKAINIVERGPAVSLIETKGFLLGNDQVIEYVEIDMGRVSLNSTKYLEGFLLIERLQQMVHPHYSAAYLLLIDFNCMITKCSLQYSTAVGY